MSIQKNDRLVAIKKIIANNTISSQEELLTVLLKEGFVIAQATLSRDLKRLGVGRIPIKNGFKYVLPTEIVGSTEISNPSTVIMGFISISFSVNIAVIKTLPAYSHTIADFIDKSEIKEIIGTVAGNDTVLAVLREGITKEQVIEAIVDALPELKGKI